MASIGQTAGLLRLLEQGRPNKILHGLGPHPFLHEQEVFGAAQGAQVFSLLLGRFVLVWCGLTILRTTPYGLPLGLEVVAQDAGHSRHLRSDERFFRLLLRTIVVDSNLLIPRSWIWYVVMHKCVGVPTSCRLWLDCYTPI